MTEREFGGAWIAYWNSCIVSETLPRPNCEFQARLQIKEGNSPMVEFFANDALRWQAETIVVEMYCPFQVVNAESDNCDAWFHGMALSFYSITGRLSSVRQSAESRLDSGPTR